MLRLTILISIFHHCFTEKCYSCSSSQLHMRWPKDEDSNRLQYLHDFPWFANESCDTVRNLIPVVDCPNSVCIKAVIKEPPAKRDVCVESGAVVRDCWSRVMNQASSSFALDPKARNNMVRLMEDGSAEKTIGVIYTCEGFLCNPSSNKSIITLILINLIVLVGNLNGNL